MQLLATELAGLYLYFFGERTLPPPRTFQPRDVVGLPFPAQPEAYKVEKLALLFYGPKTPADAFDDITRVCQDAGLTVRRYPEYPRWLPNWFHVARLREYMVGLVRRWQPNLTQLVLIGHRQGGLLARRVIEEQLTDHVQTLLVTFGTPHQPLWRDLPRINLRFKDVPFLNISGRHDNHALPSRAHHPQSHGVFLILDQEQIFHEEEAIQQLRAFLNEPQPTAQIP